MAIEFGDWEPPLNNVFPPRALYQTMQHPPPTLKRPSAWSRLYNDFILECLEKTTERRPWLSETLEHPFLDIGIEKETLASKTLLSFVHSMNCHLEAENSNSASSSEEVTVISDKIRVNSRYPTLKTYHGCIPYVWFPVWSQWRSHNVQR